MRSSPHRTTGASGSDQRYGSTCDDGRSLDDRRVGSVTGAVCRCHLPLDAPDEPHWWPVRDAEPGPGVQVVVLQGQDPFFLRRVRRPGGWHTEGHGAAYPEFTPPKPWADTGLCWAGNNHPVIDATSSTLECEGERTPR